ncbi:hypothetical protein GALL_356790 [mine drainage metagenome]|uniref:DUF3592 domain-containing protein n=1 Tax=mine drainage metagenome TaxID=410659 RepID=A0A1J5QGE1_9ZZZZ
MLEPDKKEEESAADPPARPGRMVIIASRMRGAARAVGGFMPELGLLLFMLAMPLILVAYPAWRMADRLVDYSAARTVEAKLTDIKVRIVEIGQDQASLFEARKHYEIAFEFQGEQGRKYLSTDEMSWPAAGLKGKLENQYPVGDTYTLYFLPDRSVVMEEMVARDSFYRLSGLMVLVFMASALFFMLWKRLAHRMPSNMPRFPAATENSIMLGQLVTLAIAGLWAAAMSVSPLVIHSWLFLAVYWGAVAFISLSLRLLVFSDAADLPAEDGGKKA